ncbi:hypothetical protein CTA2_139 [Colletotrichum tanaceti]|uniref:Uncharacterized protein n=1 Tax=Colletotrichum tanaceti TaxID=1306861 RepID=A0A4V6DFT4_9PEZI|nr:hypothetical protein CTA2_139 [Colletotrichum tanaceti]TKW50216.1 hypothetical protein CTA1_12438 [Colletotrichum tanaceti]
MAVTAEERLARMQGAWKFPSTPSVTSVASTVPMATKRRAASSSSTTTTTTNTPAKRRKSSKTSSKRGSTSVPSPRRRKSASPLVPTLPAAQRIPSMLPVRALTLARTYRDFSHFFRAMDADARDRILQELRNQPAMEDEMWWRDHHYDPLYATKACKTAFLILAEKGFGEKPNQGAAAAADGTSEGEPRQTRTNAGAAAAESEDPRATQYGCYRCYTLQPEAAFEAKPPSVILHPCGRLTMHDNKQDLPVFRRGERLLRRYCIECGVRDGLYPDKALVTSMTDQRWWVCECRRTHLVSPSDLYVECRRCRGRPALRSPDLESAELIPLVGQDREAWRHRVYPNVN